MKKTICHDIVWDQKIGEWLAFCPENSRGIIVNERGKLIIERLICYVNSGYSTWEELKTLIHCASASDNFLRDVLESGLLTEANHDEPIKSAVAPSGPDFVYIHLTSNCNLTCRYCYNSEIRSKCTKHEPLTIHEYELLFNQLSSAGTKHIVFTGGEPLIYNNFFYVVELARNAGIHCSVITNGTLITQEIARQMYDILSMISISVDCIHPEINDFYRGEGSYKKSLNGIKCLAEIEPQKIQLKAVITNRNVEYIDEYYNYFKDNFGITKFRFSPISPNCLEQCMNPYMSLSWENHLLMDSIIEKCIGNDVEQAIDRCLWGELCGAANEIVSISPEGDLYPCQSFHFPELETMNVRESGFLDAYLHSSILGKVRQLSVDDIAICKACDIRYVCCGGCRALAYKLYRDMIVHNSAFCRNYRREALNLMWYEARLQQSRQRELL